MWRKVNEVLMLLPRGFDVFIMNNLQDHCRFIAYISGMSQAHSIHLQEETNNFSIVILCIIPTISINITNMRMFGVSLRLIYLC